MHLDSTHVGAALRPISGETLCGDQLGCWHHAHGVLLALADGLGHGAEAHAAAEATMRLLATLQAQPLTEIFSHCDAALGSTRGVALALAHIERDVSTDRARLTHTAVGNIRTLLWSRQRRLRRLAGARGIVGAGYRNLRLEHLLLDVGDWLVLYSDGLPEEAAIEEVLTQAEARVQSGACLPDLDALANTLLTSWANQNDDAAILIYRHSTPEPCASAAGRVEHDNP